MGVILYDISTGITWVGLGRFELDAPTDDWQIPPINSLLLNPNDNLFVFKNKDDSNDFLAIAVQAPATFKPDSEVDTIRISRFISKPLTIDSDNGSGELPPHLPMLDN